MIREKRGISRRDKAASFPAVTMGVVADILD
jgi:hypothetical protein